MKLDLVAWLTSDTSAGVVTSRLTIFGGAGAGGAPQEDQCATPPAFARSIRISFSLSVRASISPSSPLTKTATRGGRQGRRLHGAGDLLQSQHLRGDAGGDAASSALHSIHSAPPWATTSTSTTSSSSSFATTDEVLEATTRTGVAFGPNPYINSRENPREIIFKALARGGEPGGPGRTADSPPRPSRTTRLV